MSRVNEENLVLQKFGVPYRAMYRPANEIVNPLTNGEIKRKKARSKKRREKAQANLLAALEKKKANTLAISEKEKSNALAAQKERMNAIVRSLSHNVTAKNKPFQIVRGVSLNTAPKKTLTLRERKEMNRNKKMNLPGIVENVQENVLSQLKKMTIQSHSKTPKKSLVRPKQRNISAKLKPIPESKPRPMPKPGPGPMVRPSRPVPKPKGSEGPMLRSKPVPRARMKPV